MNSKFLILRFRNLDYLIHNAQEIPEKLEEMLETELTWDGYGRDIINLVIEFKEAGASSLDFEILADFSADHGLHRWLPPSEN